MNPTVLTTPLPRYDGGCQIVGWFGGEIMISTISTIKKGNIPSYNKAPTPDVAL